MGDQRFRPHYDRVVGARNTQDEIARMTDDEVVQALGAASRERDPYLANVLTTAALNATRRTRAVLDNIGEGVCAIDPSGIVKMANPAACILLGRTGDAILSEHFHALAHAHLGPEHQQDNTCPLEAALERASETARIESSFSRPDGTTFEVACTISPIVLEDITQGRIVLIQDITQRKRAENLLQQQAHVLEGAVDRALTQLAEQERLERWSLALFEATPDALILTDANGKIAKANARVDRLFGHPRADLIGKPADMLLAPRSRRAESTAGGLGTQAHDAPDGLWGIRNDGTEFPIEIETGTLPGFGEAWNLTSIHDLTVRRLSQERLRRDGSLMRDAANLAHLGAWEVDVATQRTTWSDQMFRVIGFEPGAFEPTATTLMDLTTATDRANLAAAMALAEEGAIPAPLDHVVSTPAGELRTVRSRMRPVTDELGSTSRIVGVTQEGGGGAPQSEALRRAERRLQQVIEGAWEGIVVMDLDGTITFANAAARAIAQSHEGNRYDETGAVVTRLDNEPFAIKEAFASVARRGEPIGPIDLTVTLRDGQVLTLRTSAHPLRADDGHVVGVVGSFHDVGKALGVEAELHKLTGEVDARVRARTQGIEHAFHELEAFSYTVSHDLQAPLRALDQLVAAVVEDNADLAPALARDLARIQQEATRMRRFVRAVLDLSRLNLREPERTRLDMTKLAHEAIERISEQNPSRRVEVSIQEGLVTDADGALVASLLDNLVGNAWKYSVKREIAHVQIGTLPEAPGTFFVKDDGVGFDMALGSRLFQPFSRLHAPGQFEGSGVGLASARRIVEKHGGRIWAESEPNKGAAFYFTMGPAPKA